MSAMTHGFDAKFMTWINDNNAYLLEDVSANAFEECIMIVQWDAARGQIYKVKISMS